MKRKKKGESKPNPRIPKDGPLDQYTAHNSEIRDRIHLKDHKTPTSTAERSDFCNKNRNKHNKSRQKSLIQKSRFS